MISDNEFHHASFFAGVYNREELLKAASSDVKMIFYLSSSILTLKEDVKLVHQAQKKLFLNIDFAEGVGKDKSGVQFVKKLGVDGVITTRSSIIKYARDLGLLAIQRFFIIDSRSINTTVETLKSSGANIIEIMPGNNVKALKKLREKTDVRIIAGGLVETKEEAAEIISSGAIAVSTSAQDLWHL